MTYKNICISETNYRLLKELGHTGDSFNDVLSKLLGSKNDKDHNDVKDVVMGS
jgi:predicted CopG family antitoxin